LRRLRLALVDAVKRIWVPARAKHKREKTDGVSVLMWKEGAVTWVTLDEGQGKN